MEVIEYKAKDGNTYKITVRPDDKDTNPILNRGNIDAEIIACANPDEYAFRYQVVELYANNKTMPHKNSKKAIELLELYKEKGIQAVAEKLDEMQMLYNPVILEGEEEDDEEEDDE